MPEMKTLTIDDTTYEVVDETARNSIPTKTSELTNDSGFKTTDNNTTYTLTKSGSTITLTGSDGSTNSVTDADTNTVYTHPSYTARTGKPTANQTPAFGGTFTVSQITSDATGHVTGATDRTVTIPSTAATTSAAGLMSAADKTKLDGIATGATANTGDITGVTAGNGLTGGGTSGSVTLNVGAGTGISVAADTVSLASGVCTAGTYGPSANVSGSNGATISVPQITVDTYGRVTSVTNRTYTSVNTDTNTTYSAATTSAAGLMSASDKSKLDGITTSADSVSFSRSLTSGTKIGTITINGTGTDLYCQTNTNTTYSAGTGISLSGTTFSNSGVRSISTGSTNGTISVNTGGTSAEVAVKGLGSAAYTASTAYAAASHTHSYLPLSGGTMTGDITISKSTPAVKLTAPITSGTVTWGVYGTENGMLLGINSASAARVAVYGRMYAASYNDNSQAPSESCIRNSKLVSAETNPTVNGEICWTYE